MYDSYLETMPLKDKKALQLKRLQETLERVYHVVPYYRQSFDKAGFRPENFKHLEQLQELPFLTKQDLRDTYPFGLFALPKEEICRIHASSGTTGKPVVVAYSQKDLDTWSSLVARSLIMAGATSGDILHNAFGYGLFTGGFGLHDGAIKLGAAVVPISGGNTKRQVMLMQDFQSSIISCTPSYMLNIAEYIRENNIAPETIKLKIGIFGAEPWSDNMRLEIEEKMHLKAYDIYGLTEVLGPGVACECSERQGLHIFDDNFIAEIIDPDTGEVLPEGEQGELVFTSLTKEAFPVIRYRTKDITRLNYEPCACGRTHVRMNRVTGRSDDMLIIRGVNVFPSQIESVLLQFGATEPHYLLVVDHKGVMDDLEIWVEVSEELFSDKVKGLKQLETRLREEIHSVLNISAKIKLVEPKTIPRSEGKAVRVVDRRKM